MRGNADNARRPRRFRAGSAASAVAGLCLAGFGLAGCMLATEHPDPALEVPRGYRQAYDAANAALPGIDWWRGFRSRELTGLVEQALKANLDIAVAVAQIIQAEAQAGAAGAPLYPNLTFNASAEALRSSTFGSSGSSSSGGGRSSPGFFALGLTAGYMVDFWGKNRATFLAAEENAEVTRYNRDVVALTSITAVANSYFQVLGAQDQIAVARSNLAASTRILDLIRKQFAGGTASQLDLSQQEALVATVRASIPPLEVTRDQNKAALAVLVGRAPANFPIAGGSLSRLTVPRVTAGLPSEILRQRPDVRLAEVQLAASNFSVEAAKAAFFPQIQLTGTTGYQSTALATLFTPGAWYYTLTASLTQPVFDGFLLANQLKQAQGVQLQNLQAYRKAVLSAFSNVEQALVALQKTTVQERLQQAVVDASRKAFEVAELQLRGGTVSLINVLQTQQTLFTAENTLVQVRLSRMLAAVSLFQALGGGWTLPTPACPGASEAGPSTPLDLLMTTQPDRGVAAAANQARRGIRLSPDRPPGTLRPLGCAS
jgi:outer membrane protein, multidrug efflux system